MAASHNRRVPTFTNRAVPNGFPSWRWMPLRRWLREAATMASALQLLH